MFLEDEILHLTRCTLITLLFLLVLGDVASADTPCQDAPGWTGRPAVQPGACPRAARGSALARWRHAGDI